MRIHTEQVPPRPPPFTRQQPHLNQNPLMTMTALTFMVPVLNGLPMASANQLSLHVEKVVEHVTSDLQLQQVGFYSHPVTLISQ